MSEHTGLYQYRYYKAHAKKWSEWFSHGEKLERDGCVLHWLQCHPTVPVQTRDLRTVSVSGSLTQADLFPDGDGADWGATRDHGNEVADQIEAAAYHLRLTNQSWAWHLVRCADHIIELTDAAERVLLAQNRTTLDALTAALVPFRAKETT